MGGVPGVVKVWEGVGMADKAAAAFISPTTPESPTQATQI